MSRQRRRPTKKSKFWGTILYLERLEDRTMPSVGLIGVPTWMDQGPGPILNTYPGVGVSDGAVSSIAEPPPAGRPPSPLRGDGQRRRLAHE